MDGDGETPLFVVESAEMARVVIELGGEATIRNEEGMTVRRRRTFARGRVRLLKPHRPIGCRLPR